jgi:tetratricopeptide (TPR) repeat protein
MNNRLLFALLLILAPQLSSLSFAVTQEELLKQYVSEMKTIFFDAASREKIIRHAMEMKPAPTVPEDAEKAAARGRERMQKAAKPDDFKLAKLDFDVALGKAPWLTDIYLLSGIAAYRGGWHAQALENLRLYVKVAPNVVDGRFYLGQTLIELSKVDEGLRELEEALKLEPNHAETKKRLSLWHFERATLIRTPNEEQAVLLRKAISYDKDFAQAHSRLSMNLASRGMGDEALLEAREAVRIDPKHWYYVTSLGDILLALGKIDEATAQFRAAVATSPSAETHYKLGLALGQKNMHAEALSEVREAIRLSPAAPNPRYSAGLLLRLLGDAEGAVAELREAARLLPQSADVRYQLGLALLSANKKPEARAEFELALGIDKNHAGAKEALASLGK